VEQWTHKPLVVGSNPTLATLSPHLIIKVLPQKISVFRFSESHALIKPLGEIKRRLLKKPLDLSGSM
jgi:hypothetical protein